MSGTPTHTNSARLVAHNTVLNLLGYLVPVVVGFVCVPLTIRELGSARYGILSLAGIVLGYFAVFDFGLARAMTKYVTDAIARANHRTIPEIVWTAVSVQGVIGLLGTIALVLLAPLLAREVLRVPLDLERETIQTLYLMGIAVPVIFVTASFWGVLEAVQRFDLLNLMKIPSSASTYILPFLGAILDWSLVAIVGAILVSKILILILTVIVSGRTVPDLKRFAVSARLAPSLLRFGGWLTVSNAVDPFLIYLDRVVIGSVLTVSALTYYAPPFQIVNVLLFLPLSLGVALFPQFSVLSTREDIARIGYLFARSLRYLIVFLGPVVVLLMLLAGDILRIWLGDSFAVQATSPLAILAFGTLILSLVQPMTFLLVAHGRPDILAKIHLLELPVHLVLTLYLTSRFGLIGAASAWSARVALDAALFFVAISSTIRPRLRVWRAIAWPSLSVATFAACTVLIAWLISSFSPGARVGTLLFTGAAFAGFAWRYVLEADERTLALSMLKLEFLRSRSP